MLVNKNLFFKSFIEFNKLLVFLFYKLIVISNFYIENLFKYFKYVKFLFFNFFIFWCNTIYLNNYLKIY